MRRALGPVLAALVTGLLLLAPSATAVTGSGSAAASIARAGAVTASRAEVGSCVTLIGGGFAHGRPVSVHDGRQLVRTVKSGDNGAIAAGVCFNGAAKPGLHTLTASAGGRTVASDVYVVGGSEVAPAPHHRGRAGHSRLASIVVVASLVGVPLVVLAVTVTMLLRAAGRVRSRRRLTRQAAEASLLIDSSAAAGPPRSSRRRAALIPALAGLAVAVLLCVVYGAARITDMVRQVHHSTSDLTAAVQHLQRGEFAAAGTRAQRAVDEAEAAHRDENDPVVHVLSRLPGLRVPGDVVRIERRVAESAAVSVTSAPADQQSRAAADAATVHALPDTGWGVFDDRTDQLRAAVAALAGQARARLTADTLRAPMLSAGRRYLLLVENDHQARATGGAVTTLAVLTAGRHSLTIGAVTPAGRPWQAFNLTPDFPTVAQAAVAMWEHQGGQHVDGVVAVDDVALTRLGADPAAAPLDQLRAAFDSLRAATRTSIGFDAAVVTAASGGHVQLWSAHPDEERALSALTVGGALAGRPANSFQVVTQSIDDGTGNVDAGEIRRDVAYAWRPTLRRDDVGKGLQLMNQAAVDVRLTNTSSVPQATWVLLYLPAGTGFTRAGLDGTPVTLHSAEEEGFVVLSSLVTVPANGSSLLSVQMVSPTPDGAPPVYLAQPREVPDVVAVTRV